MIGKQQKPKYDSRLAQDFAPHHRKHHIVGKTLFAMLVLAFAGGVIGGGTFFHYVATSPKINKQALNSDDSTKVYDASNHLIAQLSSKNRDYIHYNQIPKTFIDALTSTEDKKFFTDKGVDPTRIISAALHDANGNSVQGGSTLTQQLVKMSVFSTSAQDRTLKRKAQEAYLALKITRKLPKSKIFEYYCNKVFMNYNCYGIGTAARFYYGKPLNQLNLPQLALLAGMPQSPAQYNPYTFPKMATERRNHVLQAMYNNHKISAHQEQQAQDSSITQGLIPAKEQKHRKNDAKIDKEKVIDPYLQATLQNLAKKGYRQHAGLKVYTNMSMQNQQKMYDLANKDNSMGFPDNKFQIGAALVQAKSGKVNALLGGRKLNAKPFSLNRALATGRSSGSTSKPFEDYAPALQDLGWGTNHTVLDTPYRYSNSTPLLDWDHRYQGPIPLESALVQSRNIPAVRTLQRVGLNRARQFMEKGFGYNPGHPYSLQNGINLAISPLQEAAIYASFSNGGIYRQPTFIRKIKETNGTVHKFGVPKGKRAMSPGVAYAITKMLQKTVNTQNGDPKAHINGLHDSAGKSGTTQYAEDAPYHGSLPNYAAMDSWFTGFSPNFSLGIWSGYDNPMKTGHYVSANEINIVQKYYATLMKYIMNEKGVHNFGWHQPKDCGYNAYKGYYEK